MRGIAAIQAQPGLLPRAVGMAVALAAACAADFVPGRLYMVENIVEGCNSQQRSVIRELDPTTGNARLFAEIPNGLCGVHYGMTFTPDGQYLRVGEFLRSQVLQIDGDGNVSVALGPADGVQGTVGMNGMVYGASGDFFLSNGGLTRHIRRYPATGGPSEIFADANDGLRNSGSLAAGSDGKIYFANHAGSPAVIRFSADGVGTVVDNDIVSSAFASLVVDDRGDLYSWAAAGICRYRSGAPGSREFVAAVPFQTYNCITFSPLDGKLYLVGTSMFITALDRDSGALAPVESGYPRSGFQGTGAAVYVPEPSTAVVFLFMLSFALRR